MSSEQYILNDEFPLKYFYCVLGNSEFILMGDEQGIIYGTEEKKDIGNILVEILDNDTKIIELLQMYKEKIKNENCSNNSEDIILFHLQNLKVDLNNLCYYFHFTDISRYISQKYIQFLNEINIENQKYNYNVDNVKEIKKILDLSFEENKKTIKKLEDNIKKQKETLIKSQNTTFKSFVLNQLDLIIEDFNLSLLSILLYSKKDNEDFSLTLSNSNIEFKTNKDFIAYNYNLLCESRKFTSYIKGVCEVNNKIVSDEEIKNITNKNISFIHIYQFNNIVELLNLAFISIIEKNINLNICKNCKKLFITKSRTDEVYCNRISPQNKNKTCKEYGAKKTYRDEIKSNPVKSEHNRTSQYFRMKIKRCSNEREKRILNIKFKKYKQEFKEKNKKYDNKKITEKDFVEWIKNQKALS